MPKWTEEEAKLVKSMRERNFTYSRISDALAKAGYTRTDESIRKYISRGNIPKSISTTQPKILLLDIETLPIKAFVWGIRKQYIPDTMIIEDWCILSWSAKWLLDSNMMGDILTSKEAVNRNDKRIVSSIWKPIDEADIVIGHNCSMFDIKKLNSRFFYHRLPPTLPYTVIDTLTQSYKNFSFTSNKLNYLSKLIINKEKLSTNFKLWERCDRGDKEALTEMHAYNDQDVLLLEEVYLEMRPWMKTTPNLGIYMDMEEPVCGHCGSINLAWSGYYVTPANKYRSFRCKTCGGIGRSRVSSISKEQKRNLVLNTAH